MKKPRWQQFRDQRKAKKKLLTVRRTLFLLFLVLVVGGIYQGDRFFSASLWDGKHRLNLVVVAQPTLVISVIPTQKAVCGISLPDKTFVKAIHGYGAYRIETLYPLGQLENRGGELLAESVQEYLGIPIDAYLLAERPVMAKNSFAQVVVKLFKGEGETNLTKWDLARLWWQLGRIREDKFSVVDLGETSACRQVNLADGTEATEIDPQRVARIAKQIFQDNWLVNEDLAIKVLNGTGHPGLAKQAARLVDNLGGRLVGIGDWEEKITQCRLVSNQANRFSYTVQKLIKIFDCLWTSEGLAGQRSPVVLILGEDYWLKLNAK